MVGLVVVSHSRALAEAAAALAAEMVHDRPVRVEIAAGLDETTFGTDAIAILAAVTAADDGDGVVVLMDLGSAVLSAELALEMLDDDARARVSLCPAPLVEGLVAAVVAAAGGADREEVVEEAVAGLAGKQSQLDPPPAPIVSSAAAGTTFTVTNPHGLHARPAARLVTEVRAFDAAVEIRNRTTGSPWVPAASLTRVATLGALAGQEIEVRASGPQAQAALGAIVALAARAFDETMVAGVESETGRGGGGRAASPGIGIGPAWHRRTAELDLPDVPSLGAAAERQRLADALDAVRQDLRRIGSTDTTGIFDAHLLLLDDTDLLADVHARIGNDEPAPQAWSAATARVAAEFDALDDPYLKARAADVRAVAVQVLSALLGVAGAGAAGTGVLIAADLTPAEAAGLDPGRVAGVLLAFGTPTSHGAILARTKGIPAVVGLGPSILAVPSGTPVALDGRTGEVVIAPTGAVLDSFRDRAGEAARRHAASSSAADPVVTPDGVPIAVGANVGSVADAEAAAANGADLAGLVRTEFLFLGRGTAPGVDEQADVYRAIAAALGGRRITLRTLDVGGDKPLPYAPAADEDNPFLGVRGIRHSLAHPSLLADQLRAFVRVAHQTPVSIMFPMIGVLDEVVRARRLLDEAIAHEGGGEPPGLEVGLMMEIPAAALKAAAFAPYVDFFSIGTNDLTQYALAAERGNAALGALADGLDPGVLRLIDAVCRGAGERVRVSVCGELAGDEAAVPLLIGLGVRELSVAPPSIPTVKQAVRDRSPVSPARVLDLADAAAVREALA